MANDNENPALTGAVIPTFFFYVIPSILGLMALTTANLVDGIFVGNYVGSNGLAAITLLIPYFTFMFGIGLMLAIGGTVRAGKYLGEKNTAAASEIFSQSLISIFVFSVTSALLSLFIEKTIFEALAAPPTLYTTMQEYFTIIRWTLIVQLVGMVLYYFIRVDGHPILATTALVTGALLNILLDVYFIGYLSQGLAGAAYATGIAQIIQLIILCYYFLSPKRQLQFFLNVKNWKEILLSCYNGLSEFINEISAGIILLLLNWLLVARHGIDGVAAFTVINYLVFLSLMLSYGVADSLHLVVSQNYGARQLHRIRQFLLTAISTVLLIGFALVGGLLLFHDSIIGIFLDPNDNKVGILANQLTFVIWPLFIVNGANIIFSCYLTAIQKPLPSTAIAVSRSLLLPAGLLITLYWLLPQLPSFSLATDSNDFLMALPIAEWSTFILAICLCLYFRPSKLLVESEEK